MMICCLVRTKEVVENENGGHYEESGGDFENATYYDYGNNDVKEYGIDEMLAKLLNGKMLNTRSSINKKKARSSSRSINERMEVNSSSMLLSPSSLSLLDTSTEDGDKEANFKRNSPCVCLS